MYNEHDRPSTKKMLITAAAWVAGVAAIIAVVAVALGLSASHSASKSSAASPAASVQSPATVTAKVPAEQPAPAARKTTPAAVVTPVIPAPKPKKPAPKPAAINSGLGVVVIDAGHQGQGDSSLEPEGPGSSIRKAKVADGASGQYAPHRESQVNLAVALKLEKTLRSRGVTVIMVRSKENVNIANSQRAAIANSAHAALFIRLHCDGIGDSSKQGFSTLIPASNRWTGPIVASSARAGRVVQRDALAATGARNAGIVPRSDLSGFNWSKVPTILVEMGFMSSPSEDLKLTTPAYQQELADGMANGVVAFLKTK